ncbi:hypothetical protein GCM10010149_84770 [Nonomuraea roseoviolacea subsp. roseoviolacea]|uniref:CPBP family glutamic-type intramembrane protease n=1 Tax=Nonomuraea roseoviolacea TaxID=103837 RepID=UPI0031CEC220
MTPATPSAGQAVADFCAVIVIVVTPGTVALSTFLQQRLGWTRRFQLNSVYTLVTLSVAVTGCLLWPRQLGTGHGLPLLLVALAAGALLTWPVVRMDAALSRRLAAMVISNARSQPAARPTGRRPGSRTRVVPAGIAAPSPSATSGAGLRSAQVGFRRRRADGRRGHSLVWLLSVAVSEELLFRGALLGWATGLAMVLNVLVVVCVTVVFLLLHSGFGWHQVLAKVPLALATLVLSIGFATVWGAVVLHCLFNLWYWRRQSWLAASPVGTVATA